MFKTIVRYRPVILTLTLGILVSIGIFLLVQNSEENRVRQTFEQISKNSSSTIQESIGDQLFSLESLRDFFGVGRKVSRTEFRFFASNLLARQPGLSALEWLPQVFQKERKEYEANAHFDGYPDFQFTEFDSAGIRKRADKQATYFPVYYVAPLQGNEPFLGFDSFTLSQEREAMEKARDTGLSVTTSRIAVEAGGNKGSLIIVYLPIYRSGLTHLLVEDRKKDLRGFVAGAFLTTVLIQNSLKGLNLGGVDLLVRDISAPAESNLLYIHTQKDRLTPSLPSSIDQIQENLHQVFSLDFAGRKWELMFYPTGHFYASQQTILSWVVLSACLLLTILIAAYLANTIDRTVSIEVLVGKRTEELSKSNRELGRQIAERLHAEEALRETEMKYRELQFESAPYAVFEVDYRQRIPKILRANSQAERTFGWKQPEFDALHTEQILSAEVLSLMEEERRNILDGKRWTIETQSTRKDGSHFPSRIAISISPIIGPAHGVLVAEDLSAQRRAEKELSLLERITSKAAEAVAMVDKDGNIIFWNQMAEKIFGFKAEELMGKNMTQVLVPSDRLEESKSIDLRQPGDQKKTVVGLRTERRHRNGRSVPVLMTAFPIFDDKGEFFGRATSYLDLTGTSQMERKLLEQSRMAALGKMAAGIAHEIRNPLFGISTVAQILCKEVNQNQEIRELGDSMLAEIARLKKLLENLLYYARPPRLELTPTDPTVLLKEIVELHRPLLDSKQLTVKQEFTSIGSTVYLDNSQIRQVMLNLILNAIQASPEGRTITLKSNIPRSPNSDWMLEINNSGEPISPEHLEQIYEPFFSTKKEGSGLGLAVCQKIVEEHGGQILCRSTANLGTTFTVIIPEKQNSLDGHSISSRNLGIP